MRKDVILGLARADGSRTAGACRLETQRHVRALWPGVSGRRAVHALRAHLLAALPRCRGLCRRARRRQAGRFRRPAAHARAGGAGPVRPPPARVLPLLLRDQGVGQRRFAHGRRAQIPEEHVGGPRRPLEDLGAVDHHQLHLHADVLAHPVGGDDFARVDVHSLGDARGLRHVRDRPRGRRGVFRQPGPRAASHEADAPGGGAHVALQQRRRACPAHRHWARSGGLHQRAHRRGRHMRWRHP
mmetsp:Transcript_38247/g.89521  ORF Transcript_38247/g.89521 Transcript_38247/m.89521 type:complete len:242 (+) Transcript_38247:172-897(+)